MHRGMGDPPLVFGTRHRDQSSSYSRQIQYIDRPSFEIGQTSQNRMALDQSVAKSIFQMLNYPNVDLFATRFNQLQLNVSPVLDNHALAIDALYMDWNFLHAYAFQPTILIPSVLTKICQSRCRIVLIATLWPPCPWFSEVLQLLVSAPIRTPLIPKLLTKSKGKFQHPNLPLLALHAWEL